MTKSNDALDDLIALEIDARLFGFDWPNKEIIIEQAISECKEIIEAIELNEPKERLQEEIGDLIHTAISICIFAGFDTKQTIANVTEKFGARMNALKKIASAEGLDTLHGQSFDQMLELWAKAKEQCKNGSTPPNTM